MSEFNVENGAIAPHPHDSAGSTIGGGKIWYSLEDLVELLGFRRSTIYAWCKAGKFPYWVKVEGRSRWMANEVHEWIAMRPRGGRVA